MILRVFKGRQACCRRALDVRDSGQVLRVSNHFKSLPKAHGVLADVLAHMGKAMGDETPAKWIKMAQNI